MKRTLFLLLLTSLLVITTQIRCMDSGPISRYVFAKAILDSSVPAGHPDACTPEDCAVGTLAFTLSAAVGGAIALPVCAALSVPFGAACSITVLSGIPGVFLWIGCCRKTRNSQENI